MPTLTKQLEGEIAPKDSESELDVEGILSGMLQALTEQGASPGGPCRAGNRAPRA